MSDHSPGAPGVVVARFVATTSRILADSPWPVAILLTLLSVGLRLPRLSASLIHDEEATLEQHIDQPVSVIVTTFGAARNHPLYSLLAHACWSVRRSDTAIRLPALVAGVAGVVLVWLTLRGETGEVPAVWAAVALAVSAPHAAYSAFARGYTLLVLGSVAANWLLLVALRRGRVRDWVAYSAAIVLTAYAHLWGLFVLAGHGVFVAAQWLIRRVRRQDTPANDARVVGSFAIAAAISLAVLALCYGAVLSEILGMVRQERTHPFATELGAAVAWLIPLSHPDATLGAWGLASICAVVAGATGRLWSQPLALQSGVLVVLSGILLVAFRPANFYARFLIFLLPSLFTLAACSASAFPLLAAPGATTIAWCDRPNRVSATLAGLGTALISAAFVSLAFAADIDTPNWRHGLAPKLAWSATAVLIAARLSGGVASRWAAWFRLAFAAAAGYTTLDLVISLKDRSTWTIVALSSGAGLIVWTAAKLRAKLLAM